MIANTSDIEVGKAKQAVAEEFAHDQLPSADEIKTYSQELRPCCSKKAILLALISVLVLIGTFTIIGVIIKPSKAPDTSDESGDESDTIDRYQQVLTKLADHVDETLLQSIDTPQYTAAMWMAKDDAKTDISDQSFLQRYALTALFFSTQGTGWTSDLNFINPDRGECNWNQLFPLGDGSTYSMGVECNSNKEVTKIMIDSMNVVGEIPTEIALLTALTSLSLDRNALTGSIPSAIQTLTSLNLLSLAYNSLLSTIPSWIGSFTKLRTLILSNNDFTGSIPKSLAQCISMNTLALDDNGFTGDLSVPATMTQLEDLYIEDNLFTGTINEEFFANLNNLHVLDASNNLLEGQLSMTLLGKSNLRVLDLNNNAITGSFPDFPSSTTLELLALQNNQLRGTVPESIRNLENLKHLDLSSNSLTGQLPDSFSTLINFKYLFLSNNTGLTAGSVPAFLKEMTQLEELSLKLTRRNGTIPDWIGDLTKLTLLDLDLNQLTGKVPTTIGHLTELKNLLLNRNNLTGTLPKEMNQLPRLEMFLFNNNSITDVGTLCADIPPSLTMLIGDCHGQSPEVSCSCCSLCCDDTNSTCNNGLFWASYDPMYESQFEQNSYTFEMSPYIGFAPTLNP